MRLIVGIVVVLLVGTRADAHASGSYGNSIASSSFRYTFVENTRKSFVDAEQADAYMADHDRQLKVRFVAFQAKAEKAIAAARKAGTPVGPYDLFLPAVRLIKASDVARIAKPAYPLNLVLDVSTPDAEASFEVTATRPWTAKQIVALTTSLTKLARPVVDNEYSDERSQREQALVEAAGFEVPIAVTHVGERFGLYVGTVTEVPSRDRARLVAKLQATLDRLAPRVAANLAQADASTRLHVDGLRPIQPLVDQHPQKLPGAFHPWGPLVSGDLIRISADLGHVTAILMIAPRGKYTWDDVYPGMTAVLRDAGAADAHRALIEAEAERLRGDPR